MQDLKGPEIGNCSWKSHEKCWIWLVPYWKTKLRPRRKTLNWNLSMSCWSSLP